jgi:hypothetical protein
MLGGLPAIVIVPIFNRACHSYPGLGGQYSGAMMGWVYKMSKKRLH